MMLDVGRNVMAKKQNVIPRELTLPSRAIAKHNLGLLAVVLRVMKQHLWVA
ncbi:hypothetical protein [Sodalis sp. dw_96]|uniref:hypothetical protein n=1 Tax=Sodalis sp. dw_96 TaxID=2719794 RepID=UPI001BD2F74E|nr:hypothetical protein [Sodalis sp. dw_96]